MKDIRTFGERLEDEIKARRGTPQGTQKALAAFCGIDASAVSQWIHGRTRPGIENLNCIARFFGYDPAEVLGWGGPSFWSGTVERGQVESMVAAPVSTDRIRHFRRDERSRALADVRPLRISEAVLIPLLGLVPANYLRWTEAEVTSEFIRREFLTGIIWSI